MKAFRDLASQFGSVMACWPQLCWSAHPGGLQTVGDGKALLPDRSVSGKSQDQETTDFHYILIDIWGNHLELLVQHLYLSVLDDTIMYFICLIALPASMFFVCFFQGCFMYYNILSLPFSYMKTCITNLNSYADRDERNWATIITSLFFMVHNFIILKLDE